MVGGGVLVYRMIAVRGKQWCNNNWLVYYSDGNDSTCARISNVSKTKPELEGGIYSYARAGFGEYIGFNVLGILAKQES